MTQRLTPQLNGPTRKANLLRAAHAQLPRGDVELRFVVVGRERSPAADVYAVELPRWAARSRLSKYFESYCYWRALRRIHAEWRFDVVCFNDGATGVVAALLGPPGGVAMATFINDDNAALRTRRSYMHYTRHVYRRFQSYAERFAARRSDVVIACSRYLRDVLSEAYRPAAAIRVLYPSVDTSEWPPPERERDPRALLFAKSDPRRGGLDLLLEALGGPGPPAYDRLHVAGFPEGEYQRAFARHVPEPVTVCVHGPLDREALRSLVATCAAGAVPSLAEAFGVAAVEYAVGGLTTVHSDVGGLPEATEGLQTLSFRGGSAIDLRRALREAASRRPPPRQRPRFGHFDLYRRFIDILRAASTSPPPSRGA